MSQPRESTDVRAWAALAALCLGFFMILVDVTIVTVATPHLMQDLDADQNAVLWVTSAYLLAYATPVLITGRLGDRFGPKRLYLIGLAVFTLASLWCGLSGSIEMLITARVVQGLGAAMLNPQTMAVITRIFPAESRGQAMALWGATAGVATLVGPILGGVLVDGLGWEWIFFVNVPVGVVGLIAAWRWVPDLPTHPHTFDWLGVALSGIGLLALIFGIQNGEQRGWDAVTWGLIAGGLLVLVAFVVWQARNQREPLLPLSLFGDRNFAVSSFAIACMGLTATAMGFPLMLYAQLVLGYSATEASLLMAPMAIVSLVLAPVVGRLIDRVHPRPLTAFGFGVSAIALFWLALELGPDTPVIELLLPMAVFGLGSAFIWSPLAATATRNLPMHQAGAGSGVYNATRLVGSVIGSAAIAALMDARLIAQGITFEGSAETPGASLPAQLYDGFSTAMSQTTLLPAAVLVVGFVSVLFFVAPRHFAKTVTGPHESDDAPISPGSGPAEPSGPEPGSRPRH
ncbi:DHA2 family efflux MFS transporter permease subunit [Nocardioides insulae]|uniref:DHA2 family efflux MFS transporter permease subunit n=1 Tax=Nocardioides insulae TaxID=394734 RepID=UPI0024812CFD|nr:DHA2 family efflux MFS transporter permease subunit [Nocardioides insulae]